MIVPWRKSKPKFSEETSPCNGFLMAECVKWELSMVPTKSTSTNSSKWEGISCILHIAKCKPLDWEIRSYKHWRLLYCFFAFVMKCSLIFTHWVQIRLFCLLEKLKLVQTIDLLITYLNNCIVECHASRWCFRNHPSLECFIFGEAIYSQCFRLWIYELYTVFNLL